MPEPLRTDVAPADVGRLIAAGLAHDLHNLLSTILMALHVAKGDSGSTHGVDRLAQQAVQDAQRVVEQIRQLPEIMLDEPVRFQPRHVLPGVTDFVEAQAGRDALVVRFTRDLHPIRCAPRLLLATLLQMVVLHWTELHCTDPARATLRLVAANAPSDPNPRACPAVSFRLTPADPEATVADLVEGAAQLAASLPSDWSLAVDPSQPTTLELRVPAAPADRLNPPPVAE